MKGGVALMIDGASLSENTVYSVKKNYDLGGRTLVIPKGCTLSFDGGSIRNGILQGNDTKLENLSNDCLLCRFSGTFSDIDINVSSFGLHPSGDGSVEKTPNQHFVFERINTLIPCVKNLTLNFEKGYYGCGYGDFKSQGPGQSCRVWYGYYPLYYFDYSGLGITESLRINGNGAEILNVFPYYIGAWTEKDNVMTPFLKWNSSDKESDNCHRASEGGGFLFFRTNRSVDICVKNLSFDMNKEIMRFGGYQGWTQSQCGIFLTTNGKIRIEDVEMRNNVTDGLIVLSQKKNGEEIIPDKIEVINSRFINNMRLGISLSAGIDNIVNNCIFKGNGRIYDVNGFYRYESPWADIDVEPIVDREFASLSVEGCKFIDSNVFCIVSSHQNLMSCVVKNCSAENKVPRVYYVKSQDSSGNITHKVTEMYRPTIFMQVHSTKKLEVQDLSLKDVAFATGNSFICSEPGGIENPSDGQMWLKSAPSARAKASGIIISSGETYRQANAINLLEVSPKLINYRFDASSRKWTEIESSSSSIGFGGWDITDITYSVGESYGVSFLSSTSEGLVNINSLQLIVEAPRIKYPLITGRGISEKSGIKIGKLEVVDKSNGASALKTEPTLQSSKVGTVIYKKSTTASSGVKFSSATSVRTEKL